MAPPLAVCGASETVQVPPPPPASRSRTSWLRSCAPWVTSTYWNESELGVVKIRGSAAEGSHTSPPPSSGTAASCVRPVSPQAGCAVETSADLICCGAQSGWSWMSSAADPATCGVAIDVPSNTAKPLGTNCGSVDERTEPPGAEMSGFRTWPNGVNPADEKLVTIPLRPVTSSSMLPPTRIVVRPRVPAMNERSRSPSWFAIIAAGSGSRSGISFASPARLSLRISPTAPAARA